MEACIKTLCSSLDGMRVFQLGVLSEVCKATFLPISGLTGEEKLNSLY